MKRMFVIDASQVLWALARALARVLEQDGERLALQVAELAWEHQDVPSPQAWE